MNMRADSDSSICYPTCVLLTGVTGFLGKVVLEELFRRRDEYDLNKVIVITRPKRGKDARSRFIDNIIPSPCFSKLPERWESSVQVVEGELSHPNCGISAGMYENLCLEVTHIIHCAGSISFEAPLAESVTANVDATLNVYKFARDCPKLQRFVSTSTAYVSPQTSDPLYESLVPLPEPASKLLEDIRSERINEVEVLQLTRHPNTYTLTKCIAEHLLLDQQKTIPVTIVRPSIISASRRFPFPSWIDSHAALAAFVAAYGAGVLHVVDGDPQVLLDIVPVDDVASVLINEALFSSQGSHNSQIVYAVASLNYSAQIGAVSSIIQAYFQQKPASRRNKVYYIGPRNLIFHFRDFIHHKIPLWFAMVFYTFKRDVRMLKRTQRTASMIDSINRVFPTFTNHTYDFRPSVPLLRNFQIEEYLRLVCQGIEINLLNRK